MAVLATPKELDLAYDAERLKWLSKRFMLYAWVGVGLNSLSLIGSMLSILFLYVGIVEPAEDQPLLNSAVFWVSEILVTLVTISAFVAGIAWVRRESPDRQGVIRLIYWLFVGSHLLSLAHVLLVGLWIDNSIARGTLFDQSLLILFVSHLFAAAIIPWTVNEAVETLAPVVLVHAFLIALLTNDPLGHRVFDLAMLTLLGLPGMAVCWLKQKWFHRRFQFRSYRAVYQYVSREVEQARALHESFFPARITQGPLRLDYHYQPMSQLGGDYLHASVCLDQAGNPSSLLCAVIDVTGHGLPATLTANHLHALLKRQTQSNRMADPGELIAELNRYMHESFSGLSVFATALCMRLDLHEQRVVWASAGHPPGLLVSEGHCEPVLESTCCLLGVIEPELFDADTQELAISDNVQLVAYTDGASELPLKDGGMLGIAGMAHRVADLSSAGKLTCENMMRDLAGLTTGDRQDDILVVHLGMQPEPAPQPAPGTRAAAQPADAAPPAAATQAGSTASVS
ncbi:MAG: PP2C family protein-serine/threonine phosphatase [Phycisphaerales bacterium JB063]